MILPDMTSEQMLKVMDADREAIHQFADRFMADEGKRILRSKQTRFPCSLTKFMITPESHQRYLLNFRIASKNEAYEGGHRFYFRAIINTMYGTEAAKPREGHPLHRLSAVASLPAVRRAHGADDATRRADSVLHEAQPDDD